jgi:hypothetical protein
MNCPEFKGRLRELRKKASFPITEVSFTATSVVGAAIITVAFLGAAIAYLSANRWLPLNPGDLNVYFASARWVTEGDRLYRDVWSEYPLFANIIFATVRYLSNLFHAGVYGFYGVWIALTWVIYLYAVYRIATGTTRLAALAWLAPAPIYFTVFRFDIFPAVATLMSLFAIRRTSYLKGALWLGVAAALKGYALFMLPAYCVFIVYQRSFAAAIKVGVLAVAPMILSLLATLIFAGWGGMVAPFSFHALRTFNGVSTYDAFNYLFGSAYNPFSHLFSTSLIPGESEIVRWVAQFLQVGCALAAAAMRPRRFDDLVNSFLFAVLGFMSFSTFYSPQFVLWILPLVPFSGSLGMLISAILFSWLSYPFNPGDFLFQLAPLALFKAEIIAVSLLRLFMMFLAVSGHKRRSL